MRLSHCLLAALLAWVLQPQLLRGQEFEEEPPTTTGSEDFLADDSIADESADSPLEDEEVDLEYIDELLEGDEDVLEGAGFSYDDGGRRDPFRSLLQAADRGPDRGPRPEGVPGLLIDEITVTGVWITLDGPIAQVQSADQAKSFLLRPGDQLYDGDVINISYVHNDHAEVVFKQIVDDPTAPKPFREVVRRIEP